MLMSIISPNEAPQIHCTYMCAHAMAVLVLWIHAYCCCIVFFSQITQDQVTAFQAEAKKFNEKFKMEGPASVGTDLDKGKSLTKTREKGKSVGTDLDS